MAFYFVMGMIISQLGLMCTMPTWKEKLLALLFAIINTIIFCWK